VPFAPGAFAAQLTAAPRWLIGLAIIGLFLLHPLTDFGRSGLLARMEDIAYDVRLKLTLPGHGDPQVVIVDIDEGSLEREGRWPWSRDKLAKLTRQLFERYHSRAIGFDVIFPEPDRSSGIDTLEALAQGILVDDTPYAAALVAMRPSLDYDRQFADAMRAGPVVLAFSYPDKPQQKGELPAPLFSTQDLGHGGIRILPEVGYTANLAQLQDAAADAGHIDPVFDSDNVIRRAPMVKLYRGAYYPALSLAIARVVLEAKRVTPIFGPDDKLDALDAGGLSIPVADDGTALITFLGPRKTFRYVPATDILAGTAPADFDGAIALVGTSAKGLLDFRATPLGADFPGVEIHASMLAAMLNGAFRSTPANAGQIEALIMLVTGLMVVFAIPYRRPLVNALGVVVVVATVIAFNLLLWIKASSVVPVATTLVMLVVLFAWNMLSGFMREARKIRRVSEMFGEYVPRERVAQMVESGERYNMAGENRELTVLFCDVRGFTHLAEAMASRDVSAMMNAYLTPMTAVIHEYRGTVDKYIGDSIMAFWGAPVASAQHAQDAVETAFAMQRKMPTLATEFAKRGWPMFGVGIGINTGAMNVGDMGSEFRKAYTVLGDAVNIASRLEGLTKVYDVGIIIGEDTRRAVPGIACREIDRVRVKGKDRPVAIYEPLGSERDADIAALQIWDEALTHYRQRRFTEADALFAELAVAQPDCRLYTLYRERCATFRAAPPADDWDGATNYTTK
jgi:adenylate cyclase